MDFRRVHNVLTHPHASTTTIPQGPKEAAITVYERKMEEAEKAKEAWKEARKEARCVVCGCVGVLWF